MKWISWFGLFSLCWRSRLGFLSFHSTISKTVGGWKEKAAQPIRTKFDCWLISTQSSNQHWTFLLHKWSSSLFSGAGFTGIILLPSGAAWAAATTTQPNNQPHEDKSWLLEKLSWLMRPGGATNNSNQSTKVVIDWLLVSSAPASNSIKQANWKACLIGVAAGPKKWMKSKKFSISLIGFTFFGVEIEFVVCLLARLGPGRQLRKRKRTQTINLNKPAVFHYWRRNESGFSENECCNNGMELKGAKIIR